MRVYNQSGRRDNIYKARIKILVNALGAEEMRRQIEARIRGDQSDGHAQVPAEEIDRIAAYFAPPEFEALTDDVAGIRSRARERTRLSTPGARPISRPIARRAMPSPTISLKPIGGVPGDASA